MCFSLNSFKKKNAGLYLKIMLFHFAVRRGARRGGGIPNFLNRYFIYSLSYHFILSKKKKIKLLFMFLNSFFNGAWMLCELYIKIKVFFCFYVFLFIIQIRNECVARILFVGILCDGRSNNIFSKTTLMLKELMWNVC